MKVTSHSRNPMWNLAITIPLTVVLMYSAGFVITNTQANPFGSMLVAGDAHDTMLDRLITYGVTFLLVILTASRCRTIIMAYRNNFIISSLIVIAAMSAAWSQDPWHTLRCAFMLFISTSLILMITNEYSVEQQMQLLIIVGTVAAFLSIAVVLLLPGIGIDRTRDVWEGVFISGNHLGRICLFLLTPAIHYPSRAEGRLPMRVPYIILMLFLMGMSGSRTAWILTAAYLLLAFLLRQTGRIARRDRGKVIVLVGIVVLLPLYVLYRNAADLLALIGRNTTLSGRTDIWESLIVSAMKRPLFGFGYQAFWAGNSSEAVNVLLETSRKTGFLGTYAHSGYLSVMLECGFVGLGLIVAMISIAVRNSLVCLRSKRLSLTSWYLGIVFLTIAYNIDEETFMLTNYLPWMMFILAYANLHKEVKSISSEAII